MKSIKEQIDQQLKAKGMKQKDLAEAIGTAPSNFNKRLQSGTMRVSELEKSCKVLGVEIRLLEPLGFRVHEDE